MTKPLRAVLLYSAGHLGSAIVLDRLSKIEGVEIVGVVRAEPGALSRQNMKKRWKQFKEIGPAFAWMLLWQRIVQFVVFYIVAPLASRRHLMAAWQFANHHGIPSFETVNINSEASQHFIRTLQPDLIISAYFSQILKRPVLEIPTIGALNIHPGLLPDYKGAMNYFWVLRNGEDRAGVSVHWMDEGIDTGALLARKSFTLKHNATQQQVLVKTAYIGVRLLQRVIGMLVQAVRPPELALAACNGQYFPMPGARDFNDYFRRRRFFRIRDVVYLAAKNKRL